VLVKVCGITRLEDAHAAVEQGARALGFVFWPASPRVIDPETARTIISTLPPFVTPVGVFVNQPVDEVNAIAARVGLGAIQLHGDESIDYAERVERPVLKALALRESARPSGVDLWPERVMLLLDAHDPERHGGTGQPVDWTLAATFASRRPTLLAGGLRPENVVQAITSVRPFGIDVSSGVESSPGVKDHSRLKALFEAVASVEHQRDRAYSVHAPRS
jgi:phosphoribosylanthranilate isomerase